MTQRKTREKVRAVFLAALMVVSVFGGTMALAGTAAATVTQPAFDGDTTVVGGASVTVTGDVDDDATDVQIYIDQNGNGSFDAGEGQTVSHSAFSGAFSADIAAPDSEGVYTVYVHQNSSKLSEGAAYSEIKTVDELTVDNSGPTFSNAAPTGDTTTSQAITVDITEDTSSLNESSIQVTVNNGTADVLSSNVSASGAVSFDGTTLTVTPDTGDMPALSDGRTYTVTVSAEDTLGNVNSTNFEFTYDSIKPTFSDFSPENGETVSLQNPGDISVTIEDANTSIESITATLTSAETEYTWDINPDVASGDGIDFSNNVLVISPGEGSVPALEAGVYNLEVTATDAVGNSNTTTDYSFTVASSTPTADITANGAAELSDEDVTSKENVTITAGVSPADGEQILNDTVTLDIEGPTSSSFDNSSDVYNNETHQFTINPESNEDIASFEDGSYTVTVSGENELGYSVTETFTFTVDTKGPTVESVSVTDDEINKTDRGVNDEYVHVTFEDNDVDANSIAAEISVDGSTLTLEAGDFSKIGGTDNQFSAFMNLNPGEYDNAENDSVVVNVTAASDTVDDGNANALANADADASNTTFAIDTLGPTVEVAAPSADTVPETVSGYVNLTSVVTTFDGAASEDPTYVVITDSGEIVVENPENLDTRTLPEGEHTLEVRGSDDAGNENSDSRSFIVDNADASIEYVGDEPISGDVSLEDVFDIDDAGTANVEYSWAFDDGTGFTARSGTSFNVNDVGEGTYKLTANVVGGPDMTKTVEGVTLGFANEDVSLDSEEDEVTITIGSEVALDTLDVTLETSDNYVDQSSWTFEHANFTENEGKYTLTTDVPRDGEYTVTIENATAGVQTYEGGASASTEVDNSTPSMIDADLVSGDEDGLTVELTFSEPLDEAPTFDDFNGASVYWINKNVAAGTITVEVTEEVQTGGDTELTANGVSEAFGEDDVSASADVDFELDYSEGINVVSIPAETGSVALDDVNFGSEVDSVMTYAGGDWMSYNVQTGEGDLQNMVGGVGYIVKANSSGAVDVEVENVPEDGAMSSVNLDHGWNLVGAYQEGPQPVDQAMATLQSSADWSVETGYTGDLASSLESGQGYWLFTNADNGVLAPVDYTGLQSDQPTVANVEMTEVEGDGDDDGVLSQGENVKITADVSDDTIVSSVTVDVPSLGIHNLELNHQGGTSYSNTATIDFSDYVSPGQMYQIDVVAIDSGSNAGYANGVSLPVESTAPTITNVDQQDSDGDGNIDTAVLTFSESIDDSTVEAGDYTIGSVAAGAKDTGTTVDDNTITVSLTTADDGIGSSPVAVDYTASSTGSSSTTDLAGNALADVTISSDSAKITDSAAPAITAIEQKDADGDGNIDTAVLTFSESIDDSTVEFGDYTISGVAAGAKDTGDGVDDDTMTVSIDTSGDGSADDGIGSAPVAVDYTAGNSGSTADLAANALADVTISSDSAKITDSAAPAITITAVNATADTITVDFSEDVINADAGDDFTVEVDAGGDGTYENNNAAISDVNDAGDSDASTYEITLTNDAVTSGDDVRVTVNTGSTEIQDSAGNTANGAVATMTAT